LLGYVNPADNKCGTGRGNIGSGPPQGTFDPHSTFGHMHPGPAEWWIVEVGAISGRFENAGEFYAVEGHVLYAAPMSWHEMEAEALSGPSVQLAMGGFNLINMFNTITRPGGIRSRLGLERARAAGFLPSLETVFRQDRRCHRGGIENYVLIDDKPLRARRAAKRIPRRGIVAGIRNEG
jgi:hypothetical protein